MSRPSTTPFMFEDDQGPRYLRKTDVAARYAMSLQTLTRHLNHPDIEQRFPPPTLVVGLVGFWSVDDLDRFDAVQAEYSKHRKLKGQK